ncbi:MAG: hypothetical protein HQ559_00130 [Lentisphaerae bacterium]|nr:hypothetical protein [Lentisphaerota bacterium]
MAFNYTPPLTKLDDADFARLQHRIPSINREAMAQTRERLEAIFAGILPVQMRDGRWQFTTCLTGTAFDLVGLEGFMLLMYDNPEGLHRLMAFLRDDHLAHAKWLEREGLLSPNNENDYIGSGSTGYTRRLPQKDYRDGMPIRLKDQWVLLESQETVGVGPDLFEEFVFPYHRDIAETFGSVYYGCCEPVHTRWNVLKKLPNLQRVSVSPWCDEDFMAAALGRDYVYSRKPNPTLISTPRFDEESIRDDLRKTVRAARDCRVEIIMKDVHTLSGEPARMARWVELAREVIARET